MTKTNVQPIPSNSQHHDTPNNKTHILLSVAIFRLQLPVCWQTESTARTTSMVISKATSISSALTQEMQPITG